jgi:hypothetical protein
VINEIEVVTFLKSLGQGMSRPVLIMGNDFEEYILKNENIDNNGNITKFNCMFINELLSYQIGLYLDIPMPEAVIAYVDGQFCEEDPTIRFSYRFENGKYFATKKLKNLENNILENYDTLFRMNKPRIKQSWNNFIKNIKNKDDIAKILAFDILIFNFDRLKNEGNILLNSENEDNRKIYAIDHGHAFGGPQWSENKINILSSPKLADCYVQLFMSVVKDFSGGGIMFRALEQHINLEDLVNHSFLNIVNKIEAIDEKMIDSWIEVIPNEWFVEKEVQVAYYKNFILKQKELIRHIIQFMANNNAFSNYRGGILEWNSKNTKSTTA